MAVSGGTVQVYASVLERLAGQQFELCEHLADIPTGATADGYWLAARPDQVRCKRCTSRLLGTIQGTPEEHRCDGCGRWRQRHMDAYNEPLTQPPPALEHLAVHVAFWLCSRCRTAA